MTQTTAVPYKASEAAISCDLYLDSYCMLSNLAFEWRPGRGWRCTQGPFRFLLTGIFGIISGDGPLISVGKTPTEMRCSVFDKPFLALIREFGKELKNGKSQSYWLA